jgi:signal transduction histidine kinase
LRREVAILLSVALLVIAGLALFTLMAYRNALILLSEERKNEGERLARGAVAALGPADASPQQLRRLAPQALGVALLDADGAAIAQSGDVPSIELPPALRTGARSAAIGLSGGLDDRIAGFARAPGTRLRFLRVDLDASVLLAQRRGLRVLVPVVVVASAATLLFIVLLVRHAIAPNEALVQRARAAGEMGDAEDARSLVETFERALAALAQPVSPHVDDLAALERALAPSLESGLLLLDRDGHVLALNALGREILGAEEVAVGADVDSLGDFASPFVAELRAAMSGGTSAARREALLPAREGDPRLIGLTVHPLRRDDRSVRGHLVLFADLTDTRRREDDGRVAASLAQLGELTAGLAHELRNSLATLQGYLTLIDRRPGEERIADYLEEIRHETGHLQRVLEDFLAFARPGSVRLEVVDLEKLVRRAAGDPAIGDSRVTVHAEDLALVLADPQLLERAVRNLLHNAAQAQQGIGVDEPVTVAIAVRDQEVDLTIEDRGPGLPKELGDRLFVPFASERPGGVGLGLALAHRIVALHGGSLHVDNRDGGGVRARISLRKRDHGTNVT